MKRIVESLLALTAFAIHPALALDGDVLINQSKVQTGNITPGDAVGFPITISRPGSYKLTGNLLTVDRTAFVITANNVTIDLAGFSITCSQSITGRVTKPPVYYGISAQNAFRLTVRNGLITNCSEAIHNGNGVGSAVENMQIIDNSGIGISLGNNARLSNSVIMGSGSFGAQLGDGSVVVNNSISGNDKTVAEYNLSCGSTCVVQGNAILNSVLGGGAQTGPNSIIVGNAIGGNAKTGLICTFTLPGLIGPGFVNNTITGNGGSAAVECALPAHPNLCRPTSKICP